MPTFSSAMDPIKANEWLIEMEKNFRLLRYGKQQKVEIDSYLLESATSKWWNLNGVRKLGMDWARYMYPRHCRALNVHNLNS